MLLVSLHSCPFFVMLSKEGIYIVPKSQKTIRAHYATARGSRGYWGGSPGNPALCGSHPL